MNSPSAIFVYGTLKRGQCREKCWPLPPVGVHSAWTFGQLFDLGPYPALLPGQDRIMGQLWVYREPEMAQVLAVLDEIECTDQPGQANEYDRVIVWVTQFDTGQTVPAYAYLYADAYFLQKSARNVPATSAIEGHRYVTWPELASA
ncbi:MAG TPA: gamma-glutamylcyclotransferase [Planctomycetaceae bacterium]|nr:gamma-glutamylcyclotransferase [Planctomycetaceae bacterium]